jgi:hypothetical protein
VHSPRHISIYLQTGKDGIHHCIGVWSCGSIKSPFISGSIIDGLGNGLGLGKAVLSMGYTVAKEMLTRVYMGRFTRLVCSQAFKHMTAAAAKLVGAK